MTTSLIKKSFIESQIVQPQNGRLVSLQKAREVKLIKSQNLKEHYAQGHKFSEDDKKNILHIFHTLRLDKNFQCLQHSDTYHLTAILYGCSKITVSKVVDTNGTYEDQRKNRFIQGKEIPVTYKERFEIEIRRGLEKGMRLTSSYFKNILFEDHILVSNDTIMRKLRDWGLRWGSLTEKDFRRKTDAVTNLRGIYLKRLKELDQDKSRERVYLDESFIHKNHSFSKGWFISNENKNIYKPMGLGGRIAIMGAITRQGWLGTRPQNLKLSLSILRSNNGTKIHCYKSIKYWEVQNSKDDTEEGKNINAAVFKDYFVNCVIPFLKPRSIIILDNARYHKRYPVNTFKPTMAANKAQLQDYISSQDESICIQKSKKELIEISIDFFKKTKNEIQEIAESHGHTVLYLPPYHPELNPIEYTWSYVKRLAAETPSYSLSTLSKETLPSAFSSLSPQTVQNFFNHVQNQELV